MFPLTPSDPNPRRSIPPPSLRGHLDQCNSALIEGWCYDSIDPQQPLTVEVRLGERLLGRVVADHPRTDIVATFGVAAGFNYEPKPPLTAKQLAEVRIVVMPYEFDLRPPASKPRRFRRCVLHIGTEKTGSTSLQVFLGLNRAALMRQGIYVSRALAPLADWNYVNHIHLTNLAMQSDRFDELRAQAQVHDAAGLAAFATSTSAAFEAEVAEGTDAPTACSILLLSNEHLHSRLVSVDEVRAVRDFLAPHCDEFEIVVYLRAQHELAMSQYGLMRLNGATGIEMLPPLPYPPGYTLHPCTDFGYFDYESLLGRWAEVFGAGAMRPRLYADALSHSFGIIGDVLSLIDVPATGLRMPPTRNNNVSAKALAFAATLYQALAQRQQGQPGHPGQHLAREAIRHGLQRAAPGSGDIPTREGVRAFMAQFAATNEAVRRRWFPARPALFEVDLTRFPEVVGDVACDITDVAPMVVEIIYALQQVFVDYPGALTNIAEHLPRSND